MYSVVRGRSFVDMMLGNASVHSVRRRRVGLLCWLRAGGWLLVVGSHFRFCIARFWGYGVQSRVQRVDRRAGYQGEGV